VDDDTGLLQLYSAFLREKGLEVETAENGFEALEIFVKNRFDVVLTDVQMPTMDGIALAHEIRRLEPDTAIVLMSGDAGNESRAKPIADRFMGKPFALGRMHKLVVDMVGLKIRVR
jgi:CheY-like chemotaxis protein